MESELKDFYKDLKRTRLSYAYRLFFFSAVASLVLLGIPYFLIMLLSESVSFRITLALYIVLITFYRFATLMENALANWKRYERGAEYNTETHAKFCVNEVSGENKKYLKELGRVNCKYFAIHEIIYDNCSLACEWGKGVTVFLIALGLFVDKSVFVDPVFAFPFVLNIILTIVCTIQANLAFNRGTVAGLEDEMMSSKTDESFWEMYELLNDKLGFFPVYIVSDEKE